MDTPSERPRFTVITVIDGAGDSTATLVDSLASQRFDPSRIELVTVPTRSADGPADRAPAQAGSRSVSIVRCPAVDRSRAGARAAGLARATGEWVLFAEPTACLDRGYFRALDRFLRSHPWIDVVGTRPMRGRDRSTTEDSRDWQFGRRARVVDLRERPDMLPGIGCGSLLSLDRLRQTGVRPIHGVARAFEDAHLAASLLIAAGPPRIGIVGGARFRPTTITARTSDRGSSATDDAAESVPSGPLDLFRRARLAEGSVAAWVQHLAIDEVMRILAADETITTSIHVPEDLLPRFHDTLGRVIRQLDPDIVRAHRSRLLRSAWSDILAHGCRPIDWRSTTAARNKVDPVAGLQRVAYRYTGRPPVDTFLVDGAPVRPRFAKTMAHLYFGRALLWERISWLPAGRLVVALDGAPLTLVDRWADQRPFVRPRSLADWGALAREMPTGRLLRGTLRELGKRVYRLVTMPLWALSRMPPYRARFRSAWVLMDRVFNADDNGERLFEFLRTRRPDVNAWFVIERGTPDWHRLRDIYGDRVVAYRSFTWLMLMLDCSWVVSSHGSRAVAAPPRAVHVAGRQTWRYAFLQHGIMKDDLSKWFNRRDMDLLVVSTEAELASVVGDGSGYRYTTREARNTGLPRFDRLLAKGRAVTADDRDLVIVAPTWRMWLTDLPDDRMDRPVVERTFRESDYLRNWMAIVRSPEIAAAAEQAGRRIVFMPHPNMQSMLPKIGLPPHVEGLAFAGNDVQGIYARCALLVTDYSSVAFNAAVLDRPIVYFQFDRDVVLGGAHLGRKGYFDYERDGFGPVVTSVDAAIAAIAASVRDGPVARPEYQARIDRTFPRRDGRACERVVEAIEGLVDLRRAAEPEGPAVIERGRTAGLVTVGATSAWQPSSAVERPRRPVRSRARRYRHAERTAARSR